VGDVACRGGGERGGETKKEQAGGRRYPDRENPTNKETGGDREG